MFVKKNSLFCVLMLLMGTSSRTLAESTPVPPPDFGIRQLTSGIVIPELYTIESAVNSVKNETWSIESKTEIISSKIGTLAPALEPELWSIESKAEVISSKIDIPEPCAPTPITTSGTITGKSPIQIIDTPVTLEAPGFYCLAQDLNVDAVKNGITISENNITLDLNGYTITGGANGIVIAGSGVTVRNGTITGQTDTGITLINNANCSVEHVVVIGITGNPSIGFKLENTHAHFLTHCRALACGTEGFSLHASSKNSLKECAAVNTSGTTNTFGFVSRGGNGNIFDTCLTQGTTGTQPGTVTGGIALLDEEKNSRVIRCQIEGTEGSTNTYGIYIQAEAKEFKLTTTVTTPQDSALAVDWLDDTKYLASGSAAKTSADKVDTTKIFHFTGSTLDQITTATLEHDFVNAVAWHVDGSTSYLATGGINLTIPIQKNLAIYTFNGTTLTHIASAPNLTMTPRSIDWFANSNELAVGGIDTNEIKVYGLSGSPLSLNLLAETESATDWNQAISVSCLVDGSKKYIAAGGASGSEPIPNKLVSIYEFTGSSLDELCTVTSDSSKDKVWSVSWLNDGVTKYLAVAGLADSEPVNKELIRVYSFDGTSLDLVATPTFGANNWILSTTWLMKGTHKYLIVGGTQGTDSTKKELIKIFELDGTTLQLIASFTPITSGQILSVSLLTDGLTQYLAGGGMIGSYPDTNQKMLRIFNLHIEHAAQKCLMKYASVSNTHNSANTGIGIKAVSSLHYIAQNESCFNDINYQDVEFVKLQADAHGVDNVAWTLP